MTDDDYTFIAEWPDHLSELELAPGVVIRFPHEKPCWWWRMWQRLLLGFVWRDVWQKG